MDNNGIKILKNLDEYIKYIRSRFTDAFQEDGNCKFTGFCVGLDELYQWVDGNETAREHIIGCQIAIDMEDLKYNLKQIFNIITMYWSIFETLYPTYYITTVLETQACELPSPEDIDNFVKESGETYDTYDELLNRILPALEKIQEQVEFELI